VATSRWACHSSPSGISRPPISGWLTLADLEIQQPMLFNEESLREVMARVSPGANLVPPGRIACPSMR
jgi:hypothetical protein